MKNTERIDEKIIDDVREFLGVERGDISKDNEINALSPNMIFNNWCEWNGYIGLDERFRRVIGDIYGIIIDSSK